MNAVIIRVEGLEDKAARLEAEADDRFARADAMASVIPFGQPILAGHHSERRDQNYRAKIGREMDKGVEAHRDAQETARRAVAAAAHQSYRGSGPATLRRLERLHVERRDVDRKLAGKPCPFAGRLKVQPAGGWRCPLCSQDLMVVDRLIPIHYAWPGDAPASGCYGTQLTTRKAEINNQLAYWQAHLDALTADGFKVWSRCDFSPGDMVRDRTGWHKVVRVNPKSLSVESGHAWTDKVPYDEVTGRRAATEDLSS